MKLQEKFFNKYKDFVVNDFEKVHKKRNKEMIDSFKEAMAFMHLDFDIDTYNNELITEYFDKISSFENFDQFNELYNSIKTKGKEMSDGTPFDFENETTEIEIDIKQKIDGTFFVFLILKYFTQILENQVSIAESLKKIINKLDGEEECYNIDLEDLKYLLNSYSSTFFIKLFSYIQELKMDYSDINDEYKILTSEVEVDKKIESADTVKHFLELNIAKYVDLNPNIHMSEDSDQENNVDENSIELYAKITNELDTSIKYLKFYNELINDWQ